MRARLSLALVLSCATVAVCPAGQGIGTNDAPGLASGQSWEWIQTSADHTHFIQAGTGRRFVVWGFNYDRDDAGRLLEEYWAGEWTKVATDFQEMKRFGATVVRIHLQLGRFMKSAGQTDEENLVRLGRLARLAEKTRIYLDVTGLGCYLKQEVPPWYDALDESARWRVQAEFWRAVAGVCQGSPAIFCYDLMNEPIASGDRRGEWLPGKPLDGKYYVQRLTTNMRGRTEQEVARQWVAGMCAAIRRIDRRHLITVGAGAWEQAFGKAIKSPFRDPSVCAPLDFLSVHLYPREGKLDDDLAILKLYDIGKPVVIEEIFPLSSSIETTETFIKQSRTSANGWLSFYWGTTPAEYDKRAGNANAFLTARWLRHFTALRGEMTGEKE